MLRKIICIILCMAVLTLSACTPKVPPAASPAPPQETPAIEETPAPSEEAPAEDPTQEPEPSEEPVDMSRVSDTLMQTETFAVTLLQNLKNAYTEENTVFSPLALNAAMAALYAAADGDTEEELRTLMGYMTEPEDTVESLAYLISAVEGEHFTVGNSLHVTKRVAFSESYLDTVASPLKLATYAQDFSDQSTWVDINKAAFDAISWDIDDILTSTTAADTLYLITAFDLGDNVNYFDYPFAADTVKGSFESPTGITQAQMMHGEFTVGYAEDEYMQMVSLPINNNTMQLKLILPRDGGEDAFDEALIQYADAWLSPESTSAQAVSLTVPSFTLTNKHAGESNAMCWTEIFSMMGMTKSLRAQTVNLTGMLNPDLILPTPVNDVFSAASVSIVPAGINASNAAQSEQTASEESVELTFDRPFMVALTDTQTGALLTLGWVNQVSSGR